MKTNFGFALMGWLALFGAAFGQEKEYLQKAPRGVHEITETISQEVNPWGGVVPPSTYRNVYNRQGNLLEEQYWFVTDFRMTRRFEFSYDPRGRVVKVQAFCNDDSPEFMLSCEYNGDGSGKRTLTNQEMDGATWDFDSESWEFDEEGRFKKGYRWEGSYYERYTFRYNQLVANEYGQGKLSEIKEEHLHYDGECYSTIITEFFYDKENRLETVRHSNGDYMDWVQSYNSHGDLLEERWYNKQGEFSSRDYYRTKYAVINGLELKTEVVRESYWEYEVKEGPKEEPHSAVKTTYEYTFWEEDWNEHRTKKEEK